MKKITTILSMVIVMVSCQKKPFGIASNDTFDVDKFVANIKASYGPASVGFSYAIAVGDNIVRYGGVGKARTGTDGNEPYTAETRQEIFSVTKFITAIAVFKVLHAKNKTPDELIWKYLPDSWTIHDSYKTLTFRKLLSHNSGFPMNHRGYDSLKFMMTLPQADTARNYNNANFALCRILLPYLYFGKEYFKYEDLQDILEAVTAMEFRKLVRELVLQPSGLTYWNKVDFKDWNHEGAANYPYTLFYRWNDLAQGAAGNSDDILIAGSRGLVLSTYEIAQVMVAFEKKELVPQNIVTMMKTEGCGFDRVGGFTGAKGKYYWKNGVGPEARGPGGETIIMVFPNNVKVSINSNSNINDEDQFVAAPSRIAKAYDLAW